MDIILRRLGLQAYEKAWQAMQAFTATRHEKTADEIWLLEHPPVYTLGLNGKMEHVLNRGAIPLIKTDRGGQITYHGPGQLILYTLIDLRRKQELTIRGLVSALENAAIALLGQYGVQAHAKREAPGVYTLDKKIASIGLRVKRGCSYHGLSFNVCMDLQPFQNINPCGFKGLQMTQLADLSGPVQLNEVAAPLIHLLLQQLNYTAIQGVYDHFPAPDEAAHGQS